jgi:Gluconate 2-dehydrogenase subunit 3
MSTRVSRRVALKAFGSAAAAVPLLPLLSREGALVFGAIQKTRAAAAPKALSRAQFATLEALVEAIIPADERSPGAREARVADYVDLLLSETGDPQKQQWIDGLAALDAEAASRFSQPFARLSGPDTETLLTDISRNELSPQTPLEKFFVTTKNATIHGYYTSEIGIHKELRYQGNQPLPEFVGCQTVDGKDCEWCGQKV